MKAVISSTYDDKYFYYLPIVSFCWRKLGVDVICFIPYSKDKPEVTIDKLDLVFGAMGTNVRIECFSAPEHKEATYAQVLRLMGGTLGFEDDEILITSDVDMAVFKIPEYKGGFTITGHDLVPSGQHPMCYVSATSKDWKDVFVNSDEKTYQQAIDNILEGDECEHYRGNRWSFDQEHLFLSIETNAWEQHLIPRSNGQNQFATKRYDRDDAYILDRLNPDTIDFHMNRPGYEEKNFEIILTILKYHYPDENFDWLISYTQQYKQLL